MKAKGLLTRTSFRPKTASKEWLQRCNRSFKWERRWLVCHTRSYSALEGARCIERFHSRCQHLCKCIGTKGIVYIWKEFNSHRICLEHQHGRRFIVLKHQYGRRRRHVKTLYWAIGRATEGPLVDLSVIPQQQCYAERTLWEVQVHVTQEKQNGRLGFWNLCCIRRTEKKFVHISLLNNSIIHGMRKTEKKSSFTFHHLTLQLFMACRLRLRIAREISIFVFIWYLKSLRGLQFQFLLWFETVTEALNLFARLLTGPN